MAGYPVHLPHPHPGGQSVTNHSTPEDYAAGRPACMTVTEHTLIENVCRVPISNRVLASKQTKVGRRFSSH